jgi:hypothetical protein
MKFTISRIFAEAGRARRAGARERREEKVGPILGMSQA